MAQQHLGGEDAAWLHMERATSPMIVNGVIQLAERLPIADAHRLFEKLAALPRFRARIVEPASHLGPPSFEEASDFDLARHVEHVELERGDDGTLRAFLGDAVSKLLSPRHPLWHLTLIDRPGAGTTLLCRVHHALGDGFALLGVLMSLCDEGPGNRDGKNTRVVPPHEHHAAASGAAKAMKRLVTLPPDRPTLLKHPLGGSKEVAWSDPIPLATVKKLARATFATVNDVLVAVTAGAIGRYLARCGEEVASLELHAMVPVNLRPAGATTSLGNEFGLVVLGLPVGMGDPLARVRAVKQRMLALKSSPEAVVAHGLLRVLGWAPPALEERVVDFFGKKSSLVLTNVPGPGARLTLAGIAVSRIMFWVPQAGMMGLGISIFSYAGEVTVGVLTDASVIAHPEALVLDLHAELASLEAEVSAAPPPTIGSGRREPQRSQS